MLTGKFVKIRFRRYFTDQNLWVFIGRVIEFTENWVTVQGKGIVIFKGRPDPVDIDATQRTLVIPRGTIAHIRVLPDEFDLDNVTTKSSKFRIYIEVEGGPNTSISE